MKIVWDEPKRRTNLADHGLDLADAEFFDWDAALVLPGHRGADERQRYRAIGWLDDELVAIVFAPLGSEAVSVISMRPASRQERRLHAERQA